MPREYERKKTAEKLKMRNMKIRKPGYVSKEMEKQYKKIIGRLMATRLPCLCLSAQGPVFLIPNKIPYINRLYCLRMKCSSVEDC